jgi:hypothetical protein
MPFLARHMTQHTAGNCSMYTLSPPGRALGSDSTREGIRLGEQHPDADAKKEAGSAPRATAPRRDPRAPLSPATHQHARRHVRFARRRENTMVWALVTRMMKRLMRLVDAATVAFVVDFEEAGGYGVFDSAL